MDWEVILLKTSNRLTVTVYSPSRELTVDLCFVENGWFFEELHPSESHRRQPQGCVFRFVAGVISRDIRTLTYDGTGVTTDQSVGCRLVTLGKKGEHFWSTSSSLKVRD